MIRGKPEDAGILLVFYNDRDLDTITIEEI